MLELIENFKSQLNNRVLYALIGLGFIVGLIFISDFGVNLSDMKAEQQSLQRRLAQYGDQIDEQLWEKRGQDVKLLDEQWNKQYWRGMASGIIGSQIQSTLNTIGAQSELRRSRPITDEAPPGALGERALRVRFSGQALEAYDAIKALTLVSTGEPVIIIDEVRLTIKKDNEALLSFAGLAPIELLTQPQSGEQAPRETGDTQ